MSVCDWRLSACVMCVGCDVCGVMCVCVCVCVCMCVAVCTMCYSNQFSVVCDRATLGNIATVQ